MIYPTPSDVVRSLMNAGRPDARGEFALRHDTWADADGTMGGLLLLSKHGTCLCILLRRDPVTLDWSEGRARFASACFGAPREAFFGAVEMIPLRPGMLPVLGAFTGQGNTLQAHVERALSSIGPSGVLAGMSAASDEPFDAHVNRLESWTTIWQAVESGPSRYVGMAPCEAFLFERALRAPISEPAPHPARTCGTGQMRTFSEGPSAFVDATGRVPGYARPRGTQDGLSTFLGTFCEALSGLLWPVEMRFVQPAHWSAAVYAHYMAEGDKGTYRRQAGSKYPFLAGILEANGEIVALVDAAVPYEDCLARALNGTLGSNVQEGITRAKLRRMQGVRREMTQVGLEVFLALAARLPLDRMDALRAEWKPATGMDVIRLAHWADDLGLDMADLLRRVQRMKEGEWMSALAGARDMAERFEANLVLPVLAGGEFAGLTRKVAGRILFGGRDLDAVARLSAEWHGNLMRFENALPAGRDVVSWPALFDPFEEDGVVVRCLTRPSELREEGGFGEGGMAHCSAGYAKACYAGETHLISVSAHRRENLVRLSTAEMKVVSIHLPEPGISVVQHKGRRNAQPSSEACQALVAFYRAFEAGKVRLNRAALERRSGDGWDDGVDWSATESRKAAMAAWRPSLGREKRVTDPEAFARMVREVAGKVAFPERA